MDEVLLLVRENEKGMYFMGTYWVWKRLTLYCFCLINFWFFWLHDQNPQNYSVRKVISSDRIEKHMQGTFIIH